MQAGRLLQQSLSETRLESSQKRMSRSPGRELFGQGPGPVGSRRFPFGRGRPVPEETSRQNSRNLGTVPIRGPGTEQLSKALHPALGPGPESQEPGHSQNEFGKTIGLPKFWNMNLISVIAHRREC